MWMSDQLIKAFVYKKLYSSRVSCIINYVFFHWLHSNRNQNALGAVVVATRTVQINWSDDSLHESNEKISHVQQYLEQMNYFVHRMKFSISERNRALQSSKFARMSYWNLLFFELTSPSCHSICCELVMNCVIKRLNWTKQKSIMWSQSKTNQPNFGITF